MGIHTNFCEDPKVGEEIYKNIIIIHLIIEKRIKPDHLTISASQEIQL
jgi:hypothetical protein